MPKKPIDVFIFFEIFYKNLSKVKDLCSYNNIPILKNRLKRIVERGKNMTLKEIKEGKSARVINVGGSVLSFLLVIVTMFFFLIIIAAVAAAVALALFFIFRKEKGGCSCGCENCGQRCECKSSRKT